MMSLKVFKANILNDNDFNSPVVVLGGLLVVIILMYSFIIDPFVSWKIQKQEDLKQLLVKTEKIIAMQKVEELWQQAAGEFDGKVVKIQQAVRSSESKAMNQKKLQRILKDMLNKHHMAMDQVIFIDTESVVGMTTASIQFRVAGDLLEQFRFIHGLASYSGLLVLKSWRLNTMLDAPVSLMQIDIFFLDLGKKK